MDLIPRARLTTQFLESNASTHESVFGALAEIVDNAYDSGTKKLEIDVQNCENETCGQYYISLRDYGCGMSADEVNKVIAYGWSNKADNPEMIGMYGNGLKSGSMRCANDCLVLTKKNDECSALLLSRTFIDTTTKDQQNAKNEVICPCPSWKIKVDAKSGQRMKQASHTVGNKNLTPEEYDNADQRHDIEVDLIQKFSPFSSEEDLLAEFDSLSDHGTCIYLYNLGLNENGKTELNIDNDNDEDDIIDVGTQRSNQESESLKQFLQYIYLKPKMEIYLRSKLIVPSRPYDQMYERRKYILPQSKFRSISKQKSAEMKEKKKKIEKKIRDAKGKVAEYNRRISESANKEMMQELRKLNLNIEGHNMDIKELDSNIKAVLNKNTKEQEFAMYLGYNIRDRKSSGLRLYNKNRLIVSVDGNAWQSWPLGVLACVDVPPSLMQPSMSKQRFNDEREFKFLQKICLERACDYVRRVRIEFEKWEKFGYSSTFDDEEPQLDEIIQKKLDDELPPVFRCTECGKYRTVKNWKELGIAPEFFNCSDNPDEKYNQCNKEEKRLVTKELDLLPSIKTERGDSDLEEVAVSPDKKKNRNNQNGNHQRIRNISRGSSRVRSQSEGFSSEDEKQVRRRLRRKRKLGRNVGNEVTSGFDRHRLDTSSDSDKSDDDSDGPEDRLPAKQIRNRGQLGSIRNRTSK
jgi:hypothetical protein